MIYFNKLKDNVSNNIIVEPNPPMIHQVNLSNFLSKLECISDDSCLNSSKPPMPVNQQTGLTATETICGFGCGCGGNG